MTVAIIGHGRSPESKRWGEIIDRCDVVVRMWDWTWQDPVDYGTKYDFGFFEIEESLVKTFTQHNKRWPTKGWVASLLRFTKAELPANTEIVSQTPWTFEAMRMGGLGETGKLEFTRGTIATCWAICRAAPGDMIILVGFDNVLAGKHLPMEQAFSKAYRTNPGSLTFAGYKPNAVKYGNHDFAIESKIMARLAERHGVTLAYARDSWPC